MSSLPLDSIVTTKNYEPSPTRDQANRVQPRFDDALRQAQDTPSSRYESESNDSSSQPSEGKKAESSAAEDSIPDKEPVSSDEKKETPSSDSEIVKVDEEALIPSGVAEKDGGKDANALPAEEPADKDKKRDDSEGIGVLVPIPEVIPEDPYALTVDPNFVKEIDADGSEKGNALDQPVDTNPEQSAVDVKELAESEIPDAEPGDGNRPKEKDRQIQITEAEIDSSGDQPLGGEGQENQSESSLVEQQLGDYHDSPNREGDTIRSSLTAENKSETQVQSIGKQKGRTLRKENPKVKKTSNSSPSEGKALKAVEIAQIAATIEQQVTKEESNSPPTDSSNPKASIPDTSRADAKVPLEQQDGPLKSLRPLSKDQQSIDQLPKVNRIRFVQRVARAFQTIGGTGGEIRLRLSPPELGAVRLQVTMDKGVLSAQMETETTAARRVLLDNLGALRERLATQDVRIDRFDVDLMDHSSTDARNMGDQQQSGNRPQQRNTNFVNSAQEDDSISLDMKMPGNRIVDDVNGVNVVI